MAERERAIELLAAAPKRTPDDERGGACVGLDPLGAIGQSGI